MKFIILLLLCLTVEAQVPANQTSLTNPVVVTKASSIAWDASPESVQTYTVYRQILGQWLKIGTTNGTAFPLTTVVNESGLYIFAVTVTNVLGLESDKSEALYCRYYGIPPAPKARIENPYRPAGGQ